MSDLKHYTLDFVRLFWPDILMLFRVSFQRLKHIKPRGCSFSFWTDEAEYYLIFGRRKLESSIPETTKQIPALPKPKASKPKQAK